ncbi:RHS repeat protein [Diaphorobacter aerolatus]|uniref:RHS repeat protein n=1 Tax=Diaphorobacter aerolatus TaxID=1288495 RepID=A0A7H0GGJ9_9BURK|nr:RHS repeat protein [Diaphorobacter aerolatus]QNP47415.1 RHS repeat protein [Diaphorobacter aerolatus]
MACASHLIFAANGGGDTLWVFAPANWQAMEAARRAAQTHPATQLPAPDAGWVLLGKLESLGRTQRYHWAEVLGQSRITGIDDGVGRHYQLHYSRVSAAQDARHYGREGSHFHWQADSGVRLMRIELRRDPALPLQTGALAQSIDLVSYAYSAEGDLVAVKNRHGDTVRRFAWRNHLMVFHQEKSGPEHRYAYDRYEPGGKAVEQSNQEGIDYRFDYRALPEADGQPRRACIVTDSLGRVETYIFQGEAGLSRLTEHVRADGSTVRRSYNQYGHLTGVTDPLGRSVRMQVSPLGQLLSTQGPDGSTSSQTYEEGSGLLQSTTDAAGRTIRYGYDRLGRLTQIILADGSAEHYHYPDIASAAAEPATRLNADKPVRITDARGGDKHIAYTAAGQVASYTDCSGQSTRYEYDRWGRSTAVVNALGERVRYQYSDRDQLQAVHYADGSSEHYEYDARGR